MNPRVVGIPNNPLELVAALNIIPESRIDSVPCSTVRRWLDVAVILGRDINGLELCVIVGSREVRTCFKARFYISQTQALFRGGIGGHTATCGESLGRFYWDSQAAPGSKSYSLCSQANEQPYSE
jgi:hypothetical protein